MDFERLIKLLEDLDLESLTSDQKDRLSRKLQESFTKDPNVRVLVGDKLLEGQNGSFVLSTGVCQNILTEFFNLMKSSLPKDDFIEILKMVINTGVLYRD